MNQSLKKVAEKLSNFKLLARIMMILASTIVVVCVAAFVAFQFSRGVDPETSARVTAFGALKENRQLIGMFFFFVLTATLIIAIVVAYQSKDYAFPKTKMAPNKTIPVLLVVDAILCLVAAIFAILAVVLDVPVGDSNIPATGIAWAWYLIAVLFFLEAGCNACMLFPILYSHYYMPKLEEDKKE